MSFDIGFQVLKRFQSLIAFKAAGHSINQALPEFQAHLKWPQVKGLPDLDGRVYGLGGKLMKKLKLRSGLSKNKKWITTIETAFTEDGTPRLIKKVKRYFEKDRKRKAPEMDIDVSDVIETDENTEENTEEMEDLMEAIRKNMERESIVASSSSKGKERENENDVEKEKREKHQQWKKMIKQVL
ncbi:hypothetical protein DFJ73DRAFT_762437 [Zopfochytrium polystomum]|nr:hypothetical protein DFJ73DRAFT_762437 [Zopfochytrium polystomum]